MNQSDDLQLVDPGTLRRPGIYGRIVRLIMGLACFYALYELLSYREDFIEHPFTSLPNLSVMLVIALCIVNYVVNIGFGRSLGRLPAIVSVIILASAFAVAYLVTGDADHPVAGFILWSWLVYFYGHLGISFTLAAIIATPGCEMRAIPEIIGMVSGHTSPEHHCPATFITKIDQWEAKRA